ncbi:MAG: hypothetical protein ABI353_09770 [Isosphaeraceae bacterium]
MIGGTDLVFWIRDDVPAADVILRTVRRKWPDYVFQDADDPSMPSKSARGWLPRPSGREFFIYYDLAAARSWHEDGATSENLNTMIYVVLGNRTRPAANLRSITIVCGELSGEMRALMDEIQMSIMDITRSMRGLMEKDAA